MEHNKIPTASRRITAIAERIAYPRIADIGTDHALLPIYALRTGRASRAIATDIRKGPLVQARANAAGLTNIEIRQGDGLSVLAAGEADTIVISGMGGRLVVEILKNSIDVVLEAKQLVLSPQSALPYVRRYAHSQGFYISDEEILEEDGVFYTIMDIRTKPTPHPPYLEADYELGLYRKPRALFLLYARKWAAHYARIALELSQAPQTPENIAKLSSVRAKLRLYEEV